MPSEARQDRRPDQQVTATVWVWDRRIAVDARPGQFSRGAVELHSMAAPDDGWGDVGRTAGYVDSSRFSGLAGRVFEISCQHLRGRPHRRMTSGPCSGTW
jgi:hypothetical protein